MGNIIKGAYRIGNGTDYDTLYPITSADMIIEGVITTKEELETSDHNNLPSAKLMNDLLEDKVDKNTLGNLEFSVNGNTLTITDGINTWTLSS